MYPLHNSQASCTHTAAGCCAQDLVVAFNIKMPFTSGACQGLLLVLYYGRLNTNIDNPRPVQSDAKRTAVGTTRASDRVLSFLVISYISHTALLGETALNLRLKTVKRLVQ